MSWAHQWAASSFKQMKPEGPGSFQAFQGDEMGRAVPSCSGPLLSGRQVLPHA